MVECYLDYDLVKVHLRGTKGERVTDWNDYPPEKAAFFLRTPDWCRYQAVLIGKAAKETIEALLAKHALHYLRQCQGIIRLADKYGQGRLNHACARANAFGDPAYRTVKTILERGLDEEPLLFELVKMLPAFLHGPDNLFKASK